MRWTDAPIHDCSVEPLGLFTDDRGWLAEFFRHDELPAGHHPAMGYVSLTHPGVTRGPHEHRDQTDLFAFFHGRFRVWLWDARPDSPTYGHRQVFDAGASAPTRVIVPPGVVHAYRNDHDADSLVVNCPNRLYAGEGKREPVDEIRHEDDADSRFLLI